MPLLASFVGIDKRRDVIVRDLTGARRDAATLHAQFFDSVTATAVEAGILVGGVAIAKLAGSLKTFGHCRRVRNRFLCAKKDQEWLDKRLEKTACALLHAPRERKA